MTLYQKTIKKNIQVEGIGLHSGKKVRMEICPAPPSSGIHFVSNHKNQQTKFKASVRHITKTTLSTSLGINDSAQVHTVEHLLSALYGLGIDNLTIHLDDEEVPILDGSALPFVKLLSEAGIVKQKAKKSILRIRREIQVEADGKSLAIYPYSETKITCSIDFRNSLVARQRYTFVLTKNSFIREIAPARTFGFLNEVEKLQKKGFIQGGSLDNAVVVDHKGILNKGGLRFPDEFVRHKILDLIGDFSLLGYPIHGHIVAHCAGHTLHAQLMEKILAEKDAWELVEEPFSHTPFKSPRATAIPVSSPC